MSDTVSLADGRRNRRALAAALSLGAITAAVLAPSADGRTFTNPTSIVIDNVNSGNGAGGAPFPSTINVSGIAEPVLGVKVSFNNINRNVPSDIDSVLRGPGGQTVVPMSDSCSNNLMGVTLSFDDIAATSLPAAAPCATGTFKPTDNPPTETTWAITGTPMSPYGTSLSALAATPNGTWDLFTRNGGGDTANGSITGGWTLELRLASDNVSQNPTGGSSQKPTGTCSGRVATIVGTEGNDVLTGTPGPDVIAALGGNDRIRGGAGPDWICGGAGNDNIKGQGGKDRVSGEAGKDKVKGGPAKDKLTGGKGKDKIKGGPAKDKLIGGKGRDGLNGQGGRDVCKGNGGRDTATACEKERSI